MKKILIVNGPNLNLLGTRETAIYGELTLADIENNCQKLGQELKLEIEFLQSNYEGQLVDWIQQARNDADGIIINPAAYTHTSIAILDALKAYDGLVAEVHLSDIKQRESFRHHSYVSLRADKVICGLGAEGYELAMRYMAEQLGSL
jgi:3-dehydroquinate dehydratase-2